MSANRIRTVGLVCIAALFLVWCGVFIYKSSFIAVDGERHFCLFDDAMISLRYAWNLSHGNGLVWNVGERVEGFTNMLTVILMSVATLLFSKGGAVVAVQVFGAFTMLGVAYFTMRVGEALLARCKIRSGPLFSLLFFAGGLLYYPLAYWSLMGMETSLVSALLLAAVWLVLREDGKDRFVPALSIILGLAFWARPDAAIFIVLILSYRFLDVPKTSGRPRSIFKELAVVAAFIVAISIFRLAYYGNLVPNTYTLKMVGIPLAFRIENGLGFIVLFIESTWIPLALAAVCYVLNFNRHTTLLLAMILASIGYQVYVGGDPWLYWRMTAPCMPIVFVLVLAAVARIPRFTHQLAGGGVALVLVAVTASYSFRDEAIFQSLPYTVDFNHATVSAALAIDEVTEEDASLGVLWAGAIPYYAGRKGIDFLGKTDSRIAELPPDLSGAVSWRGMKSVPGHNKYDLDYSVIELKPTYVQDTKFGRDDVLEFLKKEYKGVWFRGVPLMLKKDSPSVKWDVIKKGPKNSPHAVPLERSSPIP
ncbi:MAG: hypothetical protein GY854_28280 [Deltaproteobacteria bacterium]|nr:hypothetical protein [Deltaproteobacteria bacterium]